MFYTLQLSFLSVIEGCRLFRLCCDLAAFFLEAVELAETREKACNIQEKLQIINGLSFMWRSLPSSSLEKFTALL